MPIHLVGSSATGFVAQRLRNPEWLDLSDRTPSSLCCQGGFILARYGEPEDVAVQVNQVVRQIPL